MARLMISAAGGAGFASGIPTGIDWTKAVLDSEAGRKDVAAAVTGYFKDVRMANLRKSLEGLKINRPGHLDGLPVTPDLDVQFYLPQSDPGVMSLFRFVDKSASKNPTFSFAHISAGGIVFEQAEPGKPVRIRKVGDGTPQDVKSVTWHGALGIDDDARRFDEYDIFEQNVQAVPSVWDNKMVDVHATLLTALGAGINETWDTDLIKTINAACAQILEDVGDTYGVSDSVEFALVYNHRDAELVRQALVSSLVLANDNNSKRQLEFNIRPVKTRKVPAGTMYLALPGYDMVTVEWDALFSEFGRDFERGVDAFVWRARRNAAIGNTGQLRRITPA